MPRAKSRGHGEGQSKRHASPGKMLGQSERTVDEAKIEHIFAQGSGSACAHHEIVVVDDLELKPAAAQAAVVLQGGVNLAGAARLGASDSR